MTDTLNGDAPIVIGHRGASGERPEHTLAAYELAIEQGADFIEPDLVTTKDGVLIARHEPMLAIVALDADGTILLDGDGNPTIIEESTNVADKAEFADRLTVKNLDGTPVGGWFAEDFTLEEIKELLARERIPAIRPDNTAFNDQFEVPTLAEVIELVKQVEAETGRKIGIYPETKHPTFFENQGFDTTSALLQTLIDLEFTDPDRIFIQSFEFANLIQLQTEMDAVDGVDIPLVQLYGAFTDPAQGGFDQPYDIRYNVEQGNDLDAIYGADFVDLVESVAGPITEETGYGDLSDPAVLQLISDLYAEGIGPWKETVIPRNADGSSADPSSLVDDAHDADLLVHPYTFRIENRFLPAELRDGEPNEPNFDGLEAELDQFIALGIDGFFTDNPIVGTAALDRSLQAVSFIDEKANFENAFGFFDTDTGKATIVLANTAKEVATGFETIVVLPENAVWFLVPDAHRLNEGLTAGDHYTVAEEDGVYKVFDAEGNALVARGENYAKTELAFFSDAGFNADGAEHVKMSDDGTMAWEDLWATTSDDDFNDLVIQVNDAVFA